MKDSTVSRDDLYKSGTIHTGPGEPASSVSRKTPKGKPKAAKPVTQGKLLRPGGPGGGPSKLASRPAAARPVPQAQPLPSQPTQSRPTPAQTPRPVPQPVASQSRPVRQPLAASTLAAVNGIGHSRTESSSSVNRAPPPPPTAPPAARKDTYKALYDFNGQSQIELHQLTKDEIIEVLRKDSNGTPIVLAPIPFARLTTLQVGGSPKNSTAPPKVGSPPPTSSKKRPNPSHHPSHHLNPSSAPPRLHPPQQHRQTASTAPPYVPQPRKQNPHRPPHRNAQAAAVGNPPLRPRRGIAP